MLREDDVPEDHEGMQRVKISPGMCLDGGVDKLLDWAFEGLQQRAGGRGDVFDALSAVVLVTTNVAVDQLNSQIIDRFPGGAREVLLNADAVAAEDEAVNAVSVETPKRQQDSRRTFCARSHACR